jgi:hypothetical protein
MSKLIKQIGDEYIYVDDSTIGKYKPWVVLCSILCFIIASIIFVYVPPVKDGDLISNVVGCIFAGAMFSILITAMLGVLSPSSWTSIPAYRVYISGRRFEEVYIPKITLELDQISICKAAKELEPKAKAFDDHEKELERLA